jgi:hypothetical protein
MESVLLFLGVGVGEELLGSAECTEAVAARGGILLGAHIRPS